MACFGIFTTKICWIRWFNCWNLAKPLPCRAEFARKNKQEQISSTFRRRRDLMTIHAIAPFSWNTLLTMPSRNCSKSRNSAICLSVLLVATQLLRTAKICLCLRNEFCAAWWSRRFPFRRKKRHRFAIRRISTHEKGGRGKHGIKREIARFYIYKPFSKRLSDIKKKIID